VVSSFGLVSDSLVVSAVDLNSTVCGALVSDSLTALGVSSLSLGSDSTEWVTLVVFSISLNSDSLVVSAGGLVPELGISSLSLGSDSTE
jgi:hypothetical protein